MTLSTPKLPDETALRLPMGVASPLWLLFGGAAMAGAAFYWASRWMRPLGEPTGEITAEKLSPRPEPEVEAAALKAIAAPAPEPVLEAVGEAVETVSEVTASVMETAPTIADDLTRLTGIGPKLAAALADRGVTRFAQIAAWTAEDIAALDREMRLMGRIDRDAWVAQATRFSAS